jgi:putative DNA primase/helicase
MAEVRETAVYRRAQLRAREVLGIPEPRSIEDGHAHTHAHDTEGTVTEVDPADGQYNDDRNAREFIATCHQDVRSCVYLDEWRIWDGLRWKQDLGACGMQERARQFSRDIFNLAEQCTYRPEAEVIRKRGLALGNVTRITALLKLARSDTRVTVADPGVWDADPYLLGVANGVVDLRTLHFLPAERDLMMTKTAGVPYDAAATCPKWEAFMEQIVPDAEVRHFLQVSAGYWLTGDTGAQCFWFFYGAGANGKSTFLGTLYHLLGDYAQKAGEMLSLSPKSNLPLELSTLPGVRFLVGNEVTDGMKLNETLVKDITGGDVVKGREHYEAFFAFRPACKLIMYGNHRPTITGTDGGMWRRVRLVPFTTVIPPEQRNPHLDKEFLTELPGILNWCLRGLAEWHARGLPMPKAVMQATEAYREDSDVLGEFLQETTVSVKDMNETVLLEPLYNRYGEWYAENGRRHPLTAQALRRQLQDRGYVVEKTYKGQTIFAVRMRSELDDIFAPPESATEP